MMEALVTKYKPRKIEDFVGIELAKKILSAFVRAPYSAAFLLWGPPGTGKSTVGAIVAMTITKAPSLEHPGYGLHHMKSGDASVDSIERMINDCASRPMIQDAGGPRVCLVEEIGSIGPAAQKAWLSILDHIPAETIILFTGNPYVIDAKGRMIPHALKDRFLSRVRRLDFPEPSVEDLADFLRRVYDLEMGKSGEPRPASKPANKAALRPSGRMGKPGEQTRPDFIAIARSANGNIRSGLMTLETEILVPGSFIAVAPEPAIKLVPARQLPSSRELHPRAGNQLLRDQAILLKKQGLSLKDIADRINAPASSVWRWTHAA